MQPILITDIPLELDTSKLAERLHVERDGADMANLRRMCQEALALGKPKALYGLAYIDSKDEGGVVVDSVTLTSRVLRVNLDKVHRVFPYLATGGVELEEWTNSQQDILQRYWADAIAEVALRCAMRALEAQIEERFQPGKTSSMSPGSLRDWPMEQQSPLFSILGDTRSLVGVQLTDSLLMVPRKSVSGLRFPTETGYANCQLCPREGCPGRSAAYDSTLWQNRYGR